MAEQQPSNSTHLDVSKYGFTTPEQYRETEQQGLAAAEMAAAQPEYNAAIESRFTTPVLEQKSAAQKAYGERIGELGHQMEQKWEAPQMQPADYMMHATMMAILGTYLGKGGQQSAQGAIAGMTGYLKGVHEGNHQLMETSKKEYDTNMARLKSLSDNAKSQYDAIMSELGTDQEKAQVLANQFKANFAGGVASSQAKYLSMQNIDKARNDLANINMKKDEFDAKFNQEVSLAHLHSKLRIEEEKIKAGMAGGGEAYALVNNYGIPQAEVTRLNKDQLPAVAGRVESARLTSELADLISQHPQAAGVAGQFLGKIDKYLPSRYGNESVSTVKSLLDNSIDQDKDIKGTPDEIAEARIIAKKALDVVNARALAVSKRLLVSELAMQKSVLGLENISATSAVPAYKSLANDDLAALNRFGISGNTINGLQSRFKTKNWGEQGSSNRDTSLDYDGYTFPSKEKLDAYKRAKGIPQ
jgi:hypothetical protein